MSPVSEHIIEFRRISRSECLFVLFEVFFCLFRAWIVKLGKDMSRVKLPPVGQSQMGHLTSRGLAFAVSFTDVVVTHGARWTGRKCFFRAFILAHVLRKRGVPVFMNVGICGLNGHQNGKDIDGHCWLTLNDSPYLEEAGWRGQYPHFLADGLNGIRYWMGTAESGFQPKHKAMALK
jgi:hypothetical protein